MRTFHNPCLRYFTFHSQMPLSPGLITPSIAFQKGYKLRYIHTGILKFNVVTVLVNGSETWPMTKSG